jgi:type VII secretion-associated serine protease mycosin
MPLTARTALRSAVRLLLAVLLVSGTLLVGAASPASADAIRGKQWHLGFLRATEAWRHSTGAGVTVAVIDSGVDANHPDLRGQVISGADFVDRSTDGRKDVVGHGTTVAALIAGRGDENGVIGLAYRAKILPIRVLDPQNKYDSADVVARAIRWAVDRGAKVVNLSLGSADVAPVLSDALQYAFDHDVVVVACDGNLSNNRGTTVWHPAREPGVIAVSGVLRSGKFWTGSLQGPATVLAAPAADITGAHPGGNYWNVQGTSFAAPLVSAAAALVRARYPQMSSADVVNRLITTAWDFGPRGRDAQFGFGIVNPTRALTVALPSIASNPLLPSAPPPASGGQAVPPDSPGEPTGVAKPEAAPAGDGPLLPDSTLALLALAFVGLIMATVTVVVVILLFSIRRGQRSAPAPPPGYQWQEPAIPPPAVPSTMAPLPPQTYVTQPAGHTPPASPAGPSAVPVTAPPLAGATHPPPAAPAPPPASVPAPPVSAPPPASVPPSARPTDPLPQLSPGSPAGLPPAGAPEQPPRRLGPWPPVWRRRPPH